VFLSRQETVGKGARQEGGRRIGPRDDALTCFYHASSENGQLIVEVGGESLSVDFNPFHLPSRLSSVKWLKKKMLVKD